MAEILAYKKESEGKIRWDAEAADAKFELYIPRWRVPDPPPSVIRVRIESDPPSPAVLSHRRRELENSQQLLHVPIVAEVKYRAEHTKTYRYDPLGDPKEFQIGSPYIPKSLVSSPPPTRVWITVEWR